MNYGTKVIIIYYNIYITYSMQYVIILYGLLELNQIKAKCHFAILKYSLWEREPKGLSFNK